MKCGICLAEGKLYDTKSYLELQNHKNKVHGEMNQMQGYATVKEFQGGSATRQEKERNADEKLHEAIDRLKGKR